MLDRTPSGAICKGVLQLEATFIEVKNMLYLHRDALTPPGHSYDFICRNSENKFSQLRIYIFQKKGANAYHD